MHIGGLAHEAYVMIVLHQGTRWPCDHRDEIKTMALYAGTAVTESTNYRQLRQLGREAGTA